MARKPLEILSRKCEACGFLYHPSGSGQRFCVRPFCLEQRGRQVDDYLVQDEPRPRVLSSDRRLLPDVMRDRLQSAEQDLAIAVSRPEIGRERTRLRTRIKRYRLRLTELDDAERL